jgi:hypothetical protein
MKHVPIRAALWRSQLGIVALASVLLAGCSSSSNTTAVQSSSSSPAASATTSAPPAVLSCRQPRRTRKGPTHDPARPAMHAAVRYLIKARNDQQPGLWDPE